MDMGSTPIISTIHSGKTAKRSLKGYQDSGWLLSILLTWCLGVLLNPVGVKILKLDFSRFANEEEFFIHLGVAKR